MNHINRRFIIYPGFITSENDGDRHYISASKLIQLYNLNRAKHTIIILNYIEDYYRYVPQDDDIHLYPRYRGEAYEDIKQRLELNK